MNGDAGGDRHGLWPWLVALVVVGLAVWLVFAIIDREAPEPASEPASEPGAPPAGAPAPGTVPADPGQAGREPVTGAVAEEVVARTARMRRAVRDYEEQCAARLEQTAGPGTGALVADCIRRLAAAIDAVVASDTVGAVVIDDRLAAFRERVRKLESRPPDDARVAPTRAALLSAADVLETIRDERYARSVEVDGAMGELRETARGLQEDEALAAQQERIRRYFVHAGSLLSAMARPGDPGPGAVERP